MSDLDRIFIKPRMRCSSDAWCKHYDGINHTDPEKRCRAGVLMSSVTVDRPYRYRYEGDRGTPYTSGHSYPCFTDSDPHAACSCEKREFRTQKENDERYAEMMTHLNGVMEVRVAILADAKERQIDSGEVFCPVCATGKVRYSIAESNGHVHARCSTDGCVGWME